jgi:hypothetical protein
LTEEQRNALERRKQEEQYLIARQKEHLHNQGGGPYDTSWPAPDEFLRSPDPSYEPFPHDPAPRDKSTLRITDPEGNPVHFNAAVAPDAANSFFVDSRPLARTAMRKALDREHEPANSFLSYGENVSPDVTQHTYIDHTFRWDHPEATEVFVTGTFDDWGKTVRLDKNLNDTFSKTVEIMISEKVYYKFVVNGYWTTNSHLPTERDESGNENNVLYPV